MVVVDALRLAQDLHAGKTDKAGEAYWHHPDRVARSVGLAGGTSAQVTAAHLHDTLEDTAATSAWLRASGVPDEAVALVEVLTHRDGESYADYLDRVRSDPAALLVKLADVHDNLDPARLVKLDAVTRDELLCKYGAALRALRRR